MSITFGRWLMAGVIITIAIAMVEQYDERLALGISVLTLLAVLFHNRKVFTELMALIGNPGRSGGGNVGG